MLIAAGVLLLVGATPRLAADLPGMTFHCSFDRGLRPEVCAAGSEARVEGTPEFVEGKMGQGLLVPEGCTIAFPTKGHINPREGTVALWVRRSSEERPKYARLFDISGAVEPKTSLALIYLNQSLIYGHIVVGGMNYIPWPMGDASVRDDEWQHVALTWSPQGATFYVNGVTLTSTSAMPELANLPESFYIGSDASKAYPACTPIDDLYVFDRALRSHELFALAGRKPGCDLHAANWLPNSSFEVALSPWQRRLWSAAESTVQVTDEGAHGGSHALLVDRLQETQPWWSTVWVISPWLHLQRSEPVTLSAWMRADRANVDVRMDIQRGDEGRAVQGVPADAEIGQYYKIGTEWQRLTLSGVLPISYKDGYRARLCVISKPCQVRIDDVQMASGARDYEPAAPVELGLTPVDDSTTHGLGEKAQVGLQAYRADGGSAPVETTVKVIAPDGKATERRVSVTPGTPSALKPIAMERPGHYVVAAEGEGAAASLTLAALRDHSQTPSPKTSPFGTHGGGDEAARRVGLSQYRDCSGMTWRWIEREKGQWHYDDREQGYAGLAKLGFSTCATLADAPPWAARPGGDQVPADMNEWRRYVRTVIGDFKPYVDIWEVWNEPDLKTIFAQEPETYFEILKATREIQQELHPEAKLAGLCAAGTWDKPMEWMEAEMKLGALQYMDLLAWHPYYHELPEDGYLAAIEKVNALMDRYGGRKPMIFTEFGVAGVSDWSLHIPWAADGWRKYDEAEQAALLVRQCVLGLAEGAVKLYWYQWDEERIQTGPDTFGLVRADTYRTPKLAAIAYNQLVWQLESATLPPKRLTMPGESQWGYEFTTPQGKVTVAWDPRGESSIDWPKGARVFDLWGNETPRAEQVRLTSAPVYIVLK
ncbi:MAG: hypothetical protein FJX75_07215 [Armatimonadetes bacterium]|nr:hypothetical protein [Armatimonadota bacterium]